MSRVYQPRPSRPSALLIVAQVAGLALFLGGFGGGITLALGLILGKV